MLGVLDQHLIKKVISSSLYLLFMKSGTLYCQKFFCFVFTTHEMLFFINWPNQAFFFHHLKYQLQQLHCNTKKFRWHLNMPTTPGSNLCWQLHTRIKEVTPLPSWEVVVVLVEVVQVRPAVCSEAGWNYEVVCFSSLESASKKLYLSRWRGLIHSDVYELTVDFGYQKVICQIEFEFY